MKKIVLILTLVCAGALTGMEVTKPGRYVLWEDMPEDVKSLIVMYLHKSDTLKEAIYNIKAASLINKELSILVNKMYGNQKGFATLMHILADKFGETTEAIAEQFGTPAAKVYLDLANQLNVAIGNIDFDTAMQLIQQGADVNYPAKLVIHILNTSKNIEEASNALLEASKENHALHKMINEENGDPKGIQTLIYAIINKFGPIHIQDILDYAPGIKGYIQLNSSLIRAVEKNNIDTVIQLIKQGADVNYISSGMTWHMGNQGAMASYQNITPFDYAVIFGRAEIAKLLLDAGAFIKPNDYYATHGYVHYDHYDPGLNILITEEEIEKEQENREKIREMIDEAMKEQQ